MANNYICGINTQTKRIEAPQAGDTPILAGPVKMYQSDEGLYSLNGSGYTTRSTLGGRDNWDGVWDADSALETRIFSNYAGGYSSPGPVAIDIDAGDRCSSKYVLSTGDYSDPSAVWQERIYTDANAGGVTASSVAADGAANSTKWSNWTHSSHAANTGTITDTDNSIQNSIAANRAYLTECTGNGGSNTAIVSFLSDQGPNNTDFNGGYFDLWGNAVDGISVKKVYSRGDGIFDGSVWLGSDTADEVYFNARVDTDINPKTTNTRSLGTSSLQWENLYIEGTANIDTLKADALGANLNCADYSMTNVDINSGDISGVTISSELTWSAAQSFGNQALTNVNIDSGTIDGTTIGQAVACAIGTSGIRGNVYASLVDASGDIRSAADVIAYYSSDERLKDNINTIENALDKVKSMKGVSFDWNNNQNTYTGRDIGVIAQDVEKVIPEIVTTRDTGYKAVKYERLIPVLIEAVKELSEKVELLEGSTNRSTSF